MIKMHPESKCVRMSVLLLIMTVFVGITVFLSSCSKTADKSVLYVNETYGFSLEFSNQFSENVDIKEDSQSVYFMDKEIKNRSSELFAGILGIIEVYDKKNSSRADLQEREDTYNLQYLGENERYYFGWAHATDVQAPEDASEEEKNRFSKMEQEFDQIIKTFQFIEESEESEVLALVEGFGHQMQKVSLLARENTLRQTMEENYGDYVSTALIEKWSKDPQYAPGRLTSSPWPDRIEVQYTERMGEELYKVEGIIIEITSQEKEQSGTAARRPITLIVKNTSSGWQIDEVTLGKYL
ncbi:hypothetical protein [Dehalobacterium formicoaceticum]|uniref:Lipoprotein n=1 Tax=Dehalobacterium formicoaceticum TaxID=51515 RepID=A0ABT1Y7J6_9FIRM|nr:hypothetical protein [Dehalobacterium formicoaceticum]MCR6546852.1 hypothetical protein [Dehalobacterium formicoaceticum]